MRSRIFLTLVCAFLLCIAVEAALAQMGGAGMGRGMAFDMMEQGRSYRAGQGMYGMGFMHSAGNAYGEYVTFTVDSQTGDIVNYGIAGTTLLNISIANFNYKTTSSQGSMTWVSNTDNSIIVQLHDNPAAVINILKNKDISITFTLADGVTATKEDNFVKIESAGVVGYIVGTGTATSSVSGKIVKVDAPGSGSVVFRAAPVNMPMFDNLHRRLTQEMARNRVCLELALGRNGTYNAVNYSARMQLRIQTMERDRIRLMLNATEPSGSIIAINLDNTSLSIGARERLRIHYDGQPLQCADNPDTVFNGTARPLCWISPVQERVRAQLMIYVPSFSEHTIDILVEPEVTGTPTATATSTPATPTPTKPASGFDLIAAIFGVTIVIYLRKRRF